MCHCADTFAGDFLDVVRSFDVQTFFLCGCENAVSNRVSGSGLTCSSQSQKLVLRHAMFRIQFLDNKVTFCNSTCFVHNDCFYIF